MTGGSAAAPKRTRLRYSGRFGLFVIALLAGSMGIYVPATKTVLCTDCHSGVGSDSDAEIREVASGAAGASARREHERRRDKREARIREKFPRAGGLILA